MARLDGAAVYINWLDICTGIICKFELFPLAFVAMLFLFIAIRSIEFMTTEFMGGNCVEAYELRTF